MAVKSKMLGVVAGAYVAHAFVAPVAPAQAPCTRSQKLQAEDVPRRHQTHQTSTWSATAGMIAGIGSLAFASKQKRTKDECSCVPTGCSCKGVKVQLHAAPRAFDGWAHCEQYKDELLTTVQALTLPGKGLLAMDESNGTCGLRLESVGVENTVENRQKWRQTLLGTKDLGQYCGGAILFTETLLQKTTDGKLMVDLAKENGIIPGIKVDTGLVDLVGGKDGEKWCRGLDDLKERTVDYYNAGARFAKWRTTVRVRDHTSLAVSEAAHGLARYANICQSSGLVPIIEPEILLDGEHSIEECAETFEEVWSEVFKACADFGVQLEAVLLKPSMVTPGAQSGTKVEPETVASYTLRSLKRVVPPAVPGIMFLSGGQSEIEATLNLNAMNQKPNPWHVSFSYARALQNTTLKTYAGKDENVVAAQAKLLIRAMANSKAQLGEYDPATADEDATAAEGMYVKDYAY